MAGLPMSAANAASAPYLLPANDAAITRVTSPASGERCYWHPEIKGLHLRLLSGGSAAWRYQYRDSTGSTRKVTLGKPPALKLAAAVLAAKALAGDIAVGNDPAAARRSAKQQVARQESLGQVITEYLNWKRDQRRARTVEEIERYLTSHFAHLHRAAIGEIDQFTIDTAIKRIKGQNGPKAANRAASALSGLLRWAGAKGKVTANIALAARLLPREAEKPRERVLAPGELQAIWEEAKAANSGFGRILMMLILTASRRDEIGALRWAEIGEDAITIAGNRMKGKRPHAIPLMPAIRQLLPPRNVGEYVFGASGYSGFSAWSQSQKRFNARVIRRLGQGKPEGWQMPRWTLHDFRRTFSTVMHDNKGAAHHGIEACLAHALPGVAAVYSRADQLDLKQSTLTLWHDTLRGWGIAVDGDA